MEVRKNIHPIRFICLILVLLLTSCSPVYEHMPETIAPETTAPLPEEYFTTGEVVCTAAYNTGIAYEGQYIYVENLTYCIIEDDLRTSYDDSVWVTKQRLVKYNPATKTVSSLCKNPSCMHSTDECLFCAPDAWFVSKFEIFGDWLLYEYSYNFASDPTIVDVSRTYLYNLKSGEMRQLHSNSKEGELLSRTRSNFVMNGKIYSTMHLLDYSGKAEHEASGSKEEFVPATRKFIQVYDPDTEKIEQLFEISEDMYMIALTNKRFFYMKSDRTYWSSDYSGNNMKPEETINFDFMNMCGKYAYIAGENIDYRERGYNYRGYDLETDSIFHIDFGCQIRSILIESGTLAFTTISRIDEFIDFSKNPSQYIKEMYPDVKTPEERTQLRKIVSRSIEYDGTFQLYITDELGNNKRLVFEGENMRILPYRISGNYLYGTVGYADPNNNFEVTVPDNNGLCALNLETGEITLIPQLEIYLDSQQ